MNTTITPQEGGNELPQNNVNESLINGENQSSQNENMQQRKFYLSYVIIAVNVLIWIFTEYYSKKYDTDANFIFGAKFNPLIMRGEYWRLITPMFLHGDIFHIMFNSYSTYAIGPTVEKLFGGARFLVIYFFAGIMGNIASFAFSTHMSVGASGAIFGLLGALVYLIRKDRRIFKSSFGMGIVVTIVYNLIYGFLNARIDNFAHIGGLIGGYAVAVGVGLKFEKKHVKIRCAAFISALIMAFAGIYIGFNSKQNIELKKYYEEEVIPSKTINDAIDSFNNKDYAKAEKISRQVLKMSKIGQDVRATALDILASSLINQGKASEVAEYARTLAELDPARGHYLLGLSYLNSNDLESAKKELEEAVKLNPGNEHAAKLLEKLRQSNQ